MSKQSEKLRILQLNKLYYPAIGGIERIVQQLAEGLAEHTQMSVLVCSENKQHREETINGVNVIRLPKLFQFGSLPVSLGLNFTLRKMSKQQDIIHLHMPYPLGDIACLLSGYKGKIVLWWHSDIVRQKKMMHLYKPVMLRMLKRADAIVVATEGHIKHSSYLEPYKEKCVVIPFGVEKKIEQVADRYVEAENAQEIINIASPKEKKRSLSFLFVGRFVYYKGCDVLLEAFSRVTGAELILVGSGGMEEQLKQQAQELGITDKVQFAGSLSEEELCKQYADCDVFVLPSVAKSEAFGLVQMEAMAFGKPVINTNLPSGVPYVSLNGETGLTVEPGSANELAEAMQWMVDHKEERLQMGERARERMKAEYRLEDMTARTLALYKELAANQETVLQLKEQ